jgi:hypothetical protein
MLSRVDIARIIKETIAACETPEEIELYMRAYMIGTLAENMVDQMNAPGQRATWVKAMREKYPADFAATRTA